MEQLTELKAELLQLKMRMKLDPTNANWEKEYLELKKKFSNIRFETIKKERDEKNGKHKGK